LASRASVPLGQHTSRFGHLSPRGQQFCGRVDSSRIFRSSHATAFTASPMSITSIRHDIAVLPKMSRIVCNTPRQKFQPPIRQRHIETEVAKCVGGVLSPLLANIALSALDEHLHAGWLSGGEMSTHAQRQQRRRSRRTPQPNWRIDDFVVLVDGDRGHVEAPQDEIADVLAPLGLRLSQTKTKVVHMALLTELTQRFGQVARGLWWRPASLLA
jgi:retron-type reverse transcriptase